MRPLTPPSMAPTAEPERDGGDEEQLPRRDRREPDQADADEGRRERQDQAPPEPLGQDAAAHRAHDVRQGVDEEEHAEAGVGLVERGLDRPDQRRHEQPGPADEHQGGAAEDRGGVDPPRTGSGHEGMLTAAPDAGGRAGRVWSRHGENHGGAHAAHATQAERRPVLRARRGRDVRGRRRDPRPDRGPGPVAGLGRHGRGARVAARLRAPPRRLAGRHPSARPAVADARARSSGAACVGTRS